MKISFNSSSSFCDFIRDNRKNLYSQIDTIYNLGSCHYSENSLFVYTNDHVFRIFINDLIVEFDIFERQYFLSKLENKHIFRETEKEFYYIYYPEPYVAECFVTNIEMLHENNNQNTIIIFSLSNGRKLYLRPSELIVGTMDSWIE